MADFICVHWHKGDMMVINGRLRVTKYEDRDGKRREAMEVEVEDVYFCGPPRLQAAAAEAAGVASPGDRSGLPPELQTWLREYDQVSAAAAEDEIF